MERIDDIARYAEGHMEAGEQAAFEAALTADESLRQQLVLYREVHASLQQHFTADEQRDQLQQTLQGLRSEFFAPTATTAPAKVISFKRYLRSVVAVAAILIAIVFIWQPWKPDLFNKYAETTMVETVERGGDADRTLQEAITAFNNKDFSTAVAALDKLYIQDTANSFITFYYGVSLLQTGQLTGARAIFDRLYTGESAFKYEAAFYQAMGYVKEKDKGNAISWLQKIPADAANYDKAQELLNKLQ